MLPISIDYSSTPPIAIPQGNDVITINPLGAFNQTFNLNDTVRFQWMANIAKTGRKYYVDPLNIWFELSVSFPTQTLANDATFTNKVIQLDQSAYSHFSNIVFYAPDGAELSRINNVGIVANLYKDMHFDPWDRKDHEYQGFGGAVIDEFSRVTTVSRGIGDWTGSAAAQTYLNATTGQPVAAYNYTVTNTTGAQAFNTTFWHPLKDNYHYFQGTYPSNVTSGNWSPEWSAGPINGGQCPLNIISASNYLAPQTWFNQPDNNNFNNGAMMGTNLANNIPGYSLLQPPQTNGFEYPFHPNFCQTNFEPRFSSTVPQRVLTSGVPNNEFITTAYYCIPWFEGLGQLMELVNFKMIPMKMLHQCIIELQWNPYAYFTSWPTQIQSSRYFNIQSFQLRARVMYIEDQNLANIIDASVDRGFRLITRSIYCAPVVQFASGVPPVSNQYNLGFDSLRKSIIIFQPTDHTIRASCRQQKRLSMNVTQLQYEFLYDYFPNQPYQGNGGSNWGAVNNMQFFDALMDSFDKTYAANGQSVNPHNFCINYYENDPTSNDVNLTGNNQLGYYFENGTIGKAIYAVDFRGLEKDRGVISGLNTRDARPWNVNLNYDTSVPYPRTAQMFTFLEYDQVYEWDGSNISCKGKA